MGRKSALTPDQWVEIERRHLVDGESINALAKEFKVDESTLRKRINPNKPESGKTGKTLQALALEKAEAEKRLKDISAEIAILPVVRQEIVNDLTKRFVSISNHLAGAAEFGAATAHRLSGIAHAKVQEIDDAAPLTAESLDALKGIAVLTKVANEASQIGIGLLQANKEAIKEMNQKQRLPPARVTVEVVDASVPDA